MIISHHHKFIFVAIPKTATHAIREAIRPRLQQYDWEQCWLFEKKTFPINRLAAIPQGHFTCEQIQPYFPNGTWSKYFKFCFVRNPYDRFLSFCHFYFKEKMNDNPQELMLKIFEEPKGLLTTNVLLKPQYQFVFDKDLNYLVDFVGKFEDIANDFEIIKQKLGIPFNSLKVKNA